MAIGSPPRPRFAPSSHVDSRSGRARLGPLLLLIVVAAGSAAAWHFLASSEPPKTTSEAPTAPREATPSAPVAPRDDPDFAQRLRDAARDATRAVAIIVHVPPEARANVEAFEVFGGFEEPPKESGVAGPWELVRANFADESALLRVPAAWPRARRLRILRRDGGAAVRRDVPLTGSDLDLGVWRLPSGGRIEGLVRAAGGAAVPGARVALDELASDLLPDGDGPGSGALGETKSGRSGEFSFVNVAARRVRVEVSGAAGRANGVVADAEVFGEPLVIELAPPASIRGRLLDAEGRPIAGGRVLARMTGPEETSGETSAPTGADGAFALDDLAQGYYSLLATCDGFAPHFVAHAHTDVAGLDLRLDRLAAARFVLVNGPKDWTAPATWRIVEAAAAGGRWTTPAELAWAHEHELVVHGIPAGRCALEVTLPGAAPIVTPVVSFEPNTTTELGSFTLAAGANVAITVTDDAGKPVRARVALASPHVVDTASGLDPFRFDHEERVTDEAGRCVWRDLPAGRRVVAARPLDAERAGADALAVVEVPARGRVDAAPLVIRPGGSIAGSVRTSGGAPLAEMTVTLAGLGRKLEATTDVDGRYELRGLLAGRYLVTVLRRDEGPPRDLGVALEPRENPSAAVDVAAGATTARDFTVDVE